MKLLFFISILSFLNLPLKSQSHDFADSLAKVESNEVILLEYEYLLCIGSFEFPCEEYKGEGPYKDDYVIWKSGDSIYIKKFNACGSSDVINVSDWDNNPIDLMIKSQNDLNFTKVQHPKSFNPEDSTIMFSDFTSESYYKFYFPTKNIEEFGLRHSDLWKSEYDNWVQVNNEKEYEHLKYPYKKKPILEAFIYPTLEKIRELDSRLDVNINP